mmetsp:Transcript_1717/g.6016  ORF Transcript_1717/g.6016 Transcript_1717/m.6016 type:complete len:108 (-) Transcript_1717:1035-1358(-)
MRNCCLHCLSIVLHHLSWKIVSVTAGGIRSEFLREKLFTALNRLLFPSLHRLLILIASCNILQLLHSFLDPLRKTTLGCNKVLCCYNLEIFHCFSTFVLEISQRLVI